MGVIIKITPEQRDRKESYSINSIMTQQTRKQAYTRIKVDSEYADLVEKLIVGLKVGKIGKDFLDLEILCQLEKSYKLFLDPENKNILFSQEFVRIFQNLIELLQSGEIKYSILQKDILLKVQEHYDRRREQERTQRKEKLEEKQRIEQKEIKLTDCQEKAMMALQSFAYNEEKTYFKLCGYAGTGKTFLITEYLKWLRKEGLQFVIASPTNKAIKNLRQMAKEQGVDDIKTHTVAQLLGQQPVFNEQTATEDFITGKAEKQINLKDFDMVIIDEYSMVNLSNFSDLIEKAESAKVSIVFVGDSAQLPPVGEDLPAVELSEEIDETAELLEIVRYDGEIGKIAEEIRGNNKWNNLVYPFRTTEDESVVSLSRQQWLEKAGSFFKEKKDVRFIVFRNVAASTLNAFVRGQLWGKNAPPYCIGDRLIAKSPVFKKDGGTVDPNSIILNNSEECKVLELPQLKTHCETGTQEGELQYYEVLVEGDDRNHIYLRLLTPEGERKKKLLLDLYKKEKNWNSFKNLNKLFDNVPFCYAVTCHKAQGSSIDYVFLDLPDLNRCRDRQKILYTALTRVKKQAFISK